ncbi:MAG: hypothetical protein R2911_43645 [Caldilineaceae bacterium]
MIILTLRRLRSRPGLTLLALLGISCWPGCSPARPFSQAVDRVILLEELAPEQHHRTPSFTRIIYFLQPAPAFGDRCRDGGQRQAPSGEIWPLRWAISGCKSKAPA